MAQLVTPRMIAAFLTNLLLDEDRDVFTNMSLEQQRLVRFALAYGYLYSEKREVT